MCSTCASRVQHVCTTCAPRVHLYFTGISEQWSGQGLPHYYEMITYLSLQAQIQDVRENTGAHVVHTWCTRGAHAVHTCCTRGSSVGRQCVDGGAVGSGAERQTKVPCWLSNDVVLKSLLSLVMQKQARVHWCCGSKLVFTGGFLKFAHLFLCSVGISKSWKHVVALRWKVKTLHHFHAKPY